MENLRIGAYESCTLIDKPADFDLQEEAIMPKAYDEIVNFIASGTSPTSVVEYQPSEEVKARVGKLIALEKEDALSADETTELNLYIQLEHIMRLAKAKARQLIVA